MGKESFFNNDYLKLFGVMAAAVAVFVAINSFQGASEGYDVPNSQVTGYVPPVVPAVPIAQSTQSGFPANPVSTIASSSTYPVTGTTGTVGVFPNSQVMPTSAPPGAPVQAAAPVAVPSLQTSGPPSNPLTGNGPMPVDPSVYSQVSGWKGAVSECYPKQQLSADELLPSPSTADAWAAANPAGQGDLKDKNFLSAGWLNGLDTVGGSHKNQSYDLRGDACANPQTAVLWQQSSWTPDLLRKTFSVGGSTEMCSS